MVLEWKKEEDIPKGDDFTVGILKALAKVPPSRVVIKKERWCNECNNAETSIRGLKKISKYLNKGYVKKVLNCVNENNLSNFTIKDIINLLNGKDITEGSYQRRALSILTCLGYFKKSIIEYENKKGEKKIKFLFTKQESVFPTKCYDKIKDEHINNWVGEGRTTKYF